MPHSFPWAALLMAPFILFAGWSLGQAWRTGRISSRGWTFRADQNPIGFWLTAACHFGILVGGLAFAVHMSGLIGDPSAPVRIQLP